MQFYGICNWDFGILLELLLFEYHPNFQVSITIGIEIKEIFIVEASLEASLDLIACSTLKSTTKGPFPFDLFFKMRLSEKLQKYSCHVLLDDFK